MLESFRSILGIKLIAVRLSRAIDLVARSKRSGAKRPHWFDSPVADLVETIGDKPVGDVTTDDIAIWYQSLRTRPHKRNPDKNLSPWTVDSYGRSIRAFFNELIAMGHIEESPVRRLKLPRLPAKRKKEISPEDIQKMVDASEYNARDHAMIVVLRDSGVRVGELSDMTVDGLFVEDGHGRILITDDKTHASRYAFIGPQAVEALQRYVRGRPFDSPNWLWLSHNRSSAKPKRLTRSGIYQALERIASRAGVHENWNPHAFRHALAKRMVKQGAPVKVIQGIMGHADFSTTMNMYVVFDDEELAEYHRQMVSQ